MRMARIMCAACAALALLGATGCTSARSGTKFSRDEALQPQRTYEGTVEAVTEGAIEGTKTPIGAVAGGVLGGVAGHGIGKGVGRDIATVGGVLAGAAIGALAEEGITSKKAISIVVKLDDGRVMTIVQESDTMFQSGQRVRVLESAGGRMRVQSM